MSTLKKRIEQLESASNAVEQTAVAKLRKGHHAYDFTDEELTFLITGSTSTIVSDGELQAVADGSPPPALWSGVLAQELRSCA